MIGGLAWLIRARPGLLAPLAVAALPFRFSVLSGGTGGVLLVLYVVIAAGSLALLGSPSTREGRPVGWLERALAAYIVVYALCVVAFVPASICCSQDRDAREGRLAFSVSMLNRIRDNR